MKLHKFQQSKKVNQAENVLEQENIRLKEKLFKAQEQIEWMDHEIRALREKNTELQRLFASDFLSDGGESIIFPDHHTLGKFWVMCWYVMILTHGLYTEAYEREER